jgi:hypothetical protein
LWAEVRTMKEKGLKDLAKLIAGTKDFKHKEGHILKGSGWGVHEKMPMIPGVLIGEVIKRYKIRFESYGWFMDKFGIRTPLEELFWKDTGIGCTYLGKINRKTGVVEIPAPLTDKEMEHLDKQENKDYHFFGEMDLDLSKTKKEIYKRACDIAENCGYFVEHGKDNSLILHSTYEGSFTLYFDQDDKFVKVSDNEAKEEYLLNEIPSYGGYRGGF